MRIRGPIDERSMEAAFLTELQEFADALMEFMPPRQALLVSLLPLSRGCDCLDKPPSGCWLTDNKTLPLAGAN